MSKVFDIDDMETQLAMAIAAGRASMALEPYSETLPVPEGIIMAAFMDMTERANTLISTQARPMKVRGQLSFLHVTSAHVMAALLHADKQGNDQLDFWAKVGSLPAVFPLKDK